MRDPAHTGDAADEELQIPLGLVAQVRLDDAVMTSPAVVGGRAYVVDQMGTAYCIDARAGRIVWKASPDAAGAMGANTSSPSVAQGRIYFGTTAGNFHILDARDGKVVRTLNIGTSIVSAPTLAAGSAYFQVLDAVLRCVDLEGHERWKWDHYARFQESAETARAMERLRAPASVDGMYGSPNYGGGDRFSVGADFLVICGYGGHGTKVRLDDGKDYPDCQELGGKTHACGAVALTPNYSFAITLAGLNVRDVQTGNLLWHSPGFAPRACVNPVLANGRVFWTSGANGMIYCWEPK